MPTVWESPEPIDSGLAEALACFVQRKGGSYGDRSIDRPAQKLTQKDATDDIVAVWWLLVKRDWAEFKKHASEVSLDKDGSLKVGVSYPIWMPSVQCFGDEMAERIQQYGREEYDASEVMAMKAELASLVGFTTYAYRRHELRKIES